MNVFNKKSYLYMCKQVSQGLQCWVVMFCQRFVVFDTAISWLRSAEGQGHPIS